MVHTESRRLNTREVLVCVGKKGSKVFGIQIMAEALELCVEFPWERAKGRN